MIDRTNVVTLPLHDGFKTDARILDDMEKYIYISL